MGVERARRPLKLPTNAIRNGRSDMVAKIVLASGFLVIVFFTWKIQPDFLRPLSIGTATGL